MLHGHELTSLGCNNNYSYCADLGQEIRENIIANTSYHVVPSLHGYFVSTEHNVLGMVLVAVTTTPRYYYC